MPRNKLAFSEEKRKKIIDCYLLGNSTHITARMMGVSAQGVLHTLRRFQIQSRKMSYQEKLVRTCFGCRKEKPLDDFPTDGSRKAGKGYRCHPCHALENHYRRVKCNFGLTRDDYDNLSKSQDEKCAICGEKELFRRLSVDHDHKTGKVRGLLCFDCNTALGKFKDDVEMLKKAISYLQPDPKSP